ncbi:c-type cytochrome [Spirulina subsalsa FACHB-351]|uniref:C-type cytochrome n=1 Tax=Spirulina subsalsa FACHB-351 TaxID=234711 RepID=A0ABT3L6D3_9CYAN|nr:c-type cytochrome [Spirulina subsalsa FACHB-351]
MLLALLFLSGLLFHPLPSYGESAPTGERLFTYYCAGCHAGGGNIVRRGKTLKLRALERNQVDTLEAIAELVTKGKANMSAFGDRLTPEQIQTVSRYVLEQAQNNWS